MTTGLRPRRAQKKRNPVRTAFIAVASVLVLILGAVGVYAFVLANSFDSNTQKITDAFPDASTRPSAPTGKAGEAENILLLGSDTRGSIDGSLADLTGQRSDSIMVAHIPADRKHVYIMSILRDSWVEIPGHGSAKINAALSYGGIPLAVQTIEGLLGVPIDHVAVVDFTGFKGMTDALGGVTIDNPIAFSAHGYDFPEGQVDLNGEQALTFVRERYSFSDGDFQRARNQQLYIKAVINKTLSQSTLTDPGKVTETVGSIAPYLAVDEGLNSGYLAGLALGMGSLRSNDVTFFTAPTNGTGTSDDGQSIVNIDWDKLTEVQKAFQTDTLDAYVP